LTQKVYRWKWDQILLAHELGMEEILIDNVNFLIRHRKKLQDAFQLLDSHMGQHAAEAVKVLNTENLIPFLEWLIRWGRVDDARIAWEKIESHGVENDDIRLKYIHFLVGRKQVFSAAEIRGRSSGIKGMTNPGFEKQITGRGFDWRYTADNKGKWSIRRSLSQPFSGAVCLKIRFEGKENISFGHLYQIVPVEPSGTYRLTYAWRSANITTDQGPFVDIHGYDCKGGYFKGPMMLGTHPWRKQEVDFTVPQGCHAVVVALRRSSSRRFDSKIAGVLWLDEFKLEKM
jgi:hypothetical protein